jgi:hypothetical protein
MGVFISNEMLAYVIAVFMLGIVFSVLCWPIFWFAVWDFRWEFISIVITSITSSIFGYILENLAWLPDG